MNVPDLVVAAEALGVTLAPDGERISVTHRQPGNRAAVRPVLDLIAQNKKKVLVFLKRRQAAVWPLESVEQVAKLGKFHNAFMPLRGKRVWTPKGEGVLRHVLGPTYIRVVLDNGDPNRMVDFNEYEVFPVKASEQPSEAQKSTAEVMAVDGWVN